MGISAAKVILLSIFLFLGMLLPGIVFQPKSSIEVWNINESDFPSNSSHLQEKLAFLLNYAILAPSSHNSQPWKFNVSDDEILLYAARSRWLSVADADKREIYISLGAALENLIIAAEHFGYNCTVSAFPGEEDLVVILDYTIFIGKYQFCDDSADLQFTLCVKIGDVADNHVVAIEGNCVPLLNQPSDIVVMIDQCRIH